MKLKKGDKVKVIAGKDKGREGVIERIYTNADKVLVTGVNMYKKHVRKNEQMPQGGVVDVPRPMDTAKVMYVCPKCGKASKLGYTVENGKKSRICKNCESKV
jgi:large subunit ribosomal protein L24